MATLYLVEPQTIVHKDGGRLIIKKDGTVLQTVHITKLEQVVVAGPVMFTHAAIQTLLNENIDTIFTNRFGKYYGRLEGPESKNIFLRKEQFRRHDDAQFGLSFTKSVVCGKLRNQRTILARIQKNHKIDLAQPIAILSRLIDSAKEALNLDALRGYEGQGSAIYFKAWGQGIKSEHFSFTGRTRRPPKDPINALLSLGYTFLSHTIARAVSIAGIDPYLGYLHSLEYGRPSLILDLMEEWRPALIDSFVSSMINLNVIKSDDFQKGEIINQDDTDDHNTSEAIYLTSTGFRKFIGQYERRINEKATYHLDGMERTYRDIILCQVRHFVQYIKGDVKEYMPFLIK
ncbi:MAG: CRISPR-associated endonuclease Cas1 [Deltaproteobacteria bacterium]|nr:CRISPR-associated endonuclease Cas1 [Deltaproteobacteria bacterium]